MPWALAYSDSVISCSPCLQCMFKTKNHLETGSTLIELLPVNQGNIKTCFIFVQMTCPGQVSMVFTVAVPDKLLFRYAVLQHSCSSGLPIITSHAHLSQWPCKNLRHWEALKQYMLRGSVPHLYYIRCCWCIPCFWVQPVGWKPTTVV